MWREQADSFAKRYLLPGSLESDLGFRAEIQRLSHIGLQVVGVVEIAVTAFMVSANLVLDPEPRLTSPRLVMAALMVSLGILGLIASQIPALYAKSRMLAFLSGLLTTLIVTWFSFQTAAVEPKMDDFIPGNMTLILLVTVASVPLRPIQTMLFGGLMMSIYVILSAAAQEVLQFGAGPDALYLVFILMLTLLSTALSAVVYDQRRSAWELHLSMLRASDDMHVSATRNLLAQNAASVGRLAAALSHELNSPLGALISGVDSLLLLASRQAACGGPDQQRMVLLQNDLRKSIRTSTDRLKEIVARMQRFTNLDKAEVQAANVNEILADVSALLESNYKGRAVVDLELQPLPELVCRPQQLSAVFSSLLGNAIEATNGDGRVRVMTRQNDSQVEVNIEDNGHGLAPDQVENIFDPGFKVSKGRVSTGNWGMFSSRQIIQEHGGDIHITSKQGEGTKVRVILPLEAQILT